MNSLCIVLNICGINQPQNVGYYIDTLRSLLMQNWVHGNNSVKIVVSSCLSSPACRGQLMGYFERRISYNWIQERLPVNVTFNHTCKRMMDQFGPFLGYMFIDSGITFWGQKDAVEDLWDFFISGPYGIAHAFPSNDDGLGWWNMATPWEPIDIPVGKAINFHCAIMHNDLYEAYGAIRPDIFLHDTSESTDSFLCSALNLKFGLTPRVHLLHAHSMDGASSGADRKGPLLFKTKRTIEGIYKRGYPHGLGYEECRPELGMLHDPSKFDSQGFALDPELRRVIAEELFLQPHEFSYDTINHSFVAGI